MFDIQKFAEENFNADVSTQENSENQPPIPEEFEGISENVAREIMKKSAEQNPVPETQNDVDEVDDDGNYTGEKDLSKVKIPYSRFKQTIDKKNELETRATDAEKLLEEYKKRYGDLNSQPQNNYQQNYQQPAKNLVQNQLPQKFFGEDDAKQIDEAIKQTAMQMTGLSAEDVDSIDYLDDDDPKVGIWNHAQELAKVAVYNQIFTTQAAQMQEEQRLAQLMNQAVNDFQNYTQQQAKAAEYENLRNFASGEYFKSRNPVEQQVVREADWRLQNGTATPTDYFTIQNFFNAAKYAYDTKNQQVTKQKNSPKKSAPQFPRTDNLNGVPGSGGGVNAATLAEMVHNVPWNQIPEEYKRQILNSTT